MVGAELVDSQGTPVAGPSLLLPGWRRRAGRRSPLGLGCRRDRPVAGVRRSWAGRVRSRGPVHTWHDALPGVVASPATLTMVRHRSWNVAWAGTCQERRPARTTGRAVPPPRQPGRRVRAPTWRPAWNKPTMAPFRSSPSQVSLASSAASVSSPRASAAKTRRQRLPGRVRCGGGSLVAPGLGTSQQFVVAGDVGQVGDAGGG